MPDIIGYIIVKQIFAHMTAQNKYYFSGKNAIQPDQLEKAHSGRACRLLADDLAVPQPSS